MSASSPTPPTDAQPTGAQPDIAGAAGGQPDSTPAAGARPERAPAAAPAGRRVLAQTGWEALLVLRNGEQLLLTLVLPVLALLGLSRTTFVSVDVPPGASAVDVVAPGVLAMAVMSTAFTGQAIATGFDRRHGVLRLFGTTPLGRSGLLAGRLLAVLAVEVLQVAVLGSVALLLGWRPDPAGWLVTVPLLVLGTAAFTALGLLLAGTMRAEAVLAVANLVWVVLLLGGGVLIPLAQMPGWSGAVGALLPSGALAEGLRTALLGDASTSGTSLLACAAVLAAWAAGASAACVRWFRWH